MHSMFNLLGRVRTQFSALDEFLQLLTLDKFEVLTVVAAHAVLVEAQ